MNGERASPLGSGHRLSNRREEGVPDPKNTHMFVTSKTTALIVAAVVSVWGTAIASRGVPATFGTTDDWEVFVEKGRPVNVMTVGEAITSGGALVCRGKGTVIHGGEFLFGGDFSIRARVVLPHLNGGASLIVGGHYHYADANTDAGAVRLWLGAPGGVLRVTAPGSSQYLLRSENCTIGKASDYLTANQPFDLELECHGPRFTIAINGREVYQAEAYKGLRRDWLGKVGFMPDDGEIHILDFRTQGCFARLNLPHQDLWTLGEDGYFNVRHPVIVTTGKGSLLAIGGGRKHDDSAVGPDQDLVMKRSTDGGRTWTKTQILWDPWKPGDAEPAIEAQMCSAVVDREKDRVFACATRQWFDGKNKKWRGGPWFTASDDDGRTWSPPKRVGGDIMQHWLILKTCACGIQLTRGVHSGRLIIPCYGIRTDCDEAGCVIFSDDHGKTWQQGGITGVGARIPEPTPVELASGDVMLNMRFIPRTSRIRTIAISKDGGESFGPVVGDPALPGPGCQGALLRYDWKKDGAGRILFCNPSYTGSRFRMTVKLSQDDGKTWPFSRLVYGGFSSYSDMTILPDGKVGLLFERDSFTRVTLVPISLEWLMEKDAGG